MELLENERIDDLQYKDLKIIQNKNGFCFGIDSVLLSNYVNGLNRNATIIDIGTGTGIISILLSKKIKVNKIYGIEIQKEVAEMATRSVKLNSLEDKIEIVNINVKDCLKYFEPNKIDIIVTNPPYKKINTGLLNSNKSKLISRHEIECSLEDIIQNSYSLLKDLGEFYMVHRAERLVDIMYLLRKHKLEPKNIRFVQSKQNEKPTLILIRAVKLANEYLKIDKPLIIYNEDGKYTDEILKIYNKERSENN